MDEFNSENEVGEDIEYNDASSDEQESESEHFHKNIRKRKNTVDKCADKVGDDAKKKKKVVAKPHEKRSVARSQLQATGEHLRWLLLTLFRKGLFGAAHGWNPGAAHR